MEQVFSPFFLEKKLSEIYCKQYQLFFELYPGGAKGFSRVVRPKKRAAKKYGEELCTQGIWNLNWATNFELTEGTKVSRVYVFNEASVLTESSKVILSIINAVLTIPVAFKKRYYKNLSFHIFQDNIMPRYH